MIDDECLACLWLRCKCPHATESDYPTIEEANEAIERRGWLKRTGVKAGWTTAYVAAGVRS